MNALNLSLEQIVYPNYHAAHPTKMLVFALFCLMLIFDRLFSFLLHLDYVACRI